MRHEKQRVAGVSKTRPVVGIRVSSILVKRSVLNGLLELLYRSTIRIDLDISLINLDSNAEPIKCSQASMNYTI